VKIRSLRARLLVSLLVPVGAVWAIDAWFTYDTVRRSMDTAYDRALHASALAISEHVTLGAGEPVVDLPAVALEMLDTGEQERVFYRVSYRTGGGPDTFITGYEDLPAAPVIAPAAKPSALVFYEARYRGDAIRVAALRTDLPTEPGTAVLVQVAETLGGRANMSRHIVVRALAVEFLLIALTGALVAFGVSRGLRPLLELSRQVANRSASDLTPIAEHVPREVRPLVDATNGFMARVRAAIAAQRRFIADASHQLRTPLSVLRAEADAALRREGAAELREAVERLRAHSEATSHLATQLLALARAEPDSAGAGALAPIDLASVARETCAALVPHALSHQVDLGYEGDGPASVRGDALLLRELLSNLVDNAVRHGRPAGRITVSVTSGGGTPAAPTLAVEDDGPGIPAAERERVLERFYRVPGTRGDGCGLGLAIVNEVARRHGATLHLLDGPDGKGLRVEVRFRTAP
jgi:two-component system sensor histidine kinase TctE